MTNVHILIVVASIFQWKIFQMNVKNAFLNGDLHEKVYVIPPPNLSYKFGDFWNSKSPSLEQAPYAWFQKFSTIIFFLGFVASYHDSALFVRKTNVECILLSLYVDDVISLVMIFMEFHI